MVERSLALELWHDVLYTSKLQQVNTKHMLADIALWHYIHSSISPRGDTGNRDRATHTIAT